MSKDKRSFHSMMLFIPLFLVGFYLCLRIDMSMMVFYPLYISIIFAVVHAFKYRYSQLDFDNVSDLQMEVKWSGYGIIACAIVSFGLTITKAVSVGLLIGFYLFTAAVIIHTVYLSRYLIRQTQLNK